MKVAIVVLADTESHADLGRVVNALETALECKEAGDVVQVIFDGAGTRWVPVLSNPEHRRHKLFTELQDVVAGACAFCARAFHVEDEVRASGVRFLSEHHGHPSLRSFMADGYQVVTF